MQSLCPNSVYGIPCHVISKVSEHNTTFRYISCIHISAIHDADTSTGPFVTKYYSSNQILSLKRLLFHFVLDISGGWGYWTRHLSVNTTLVWVSTTCACNTVPRLLYHFHPVFSNFHFHAFIAYSTQAAIFSTLWRIPVTLFIWPCCFNQLSKMYHFGLCFSCICHATHICWRCSFDSEIWFQVFQSSFTSSI